MSTYHNRSNEELVAEIEAFRGDVLNLFASICERLTELAKRGYKHPLHTHRQFRHHASVTAGKLIPAIVVMFNGSRDHMACFHGRSEDLQRTVASGRDFDVVYVSKGEVVERKLRAAAMSKKVLQRVFPEGKSPRSLPEQRAILQTELDAAPATHLRGKPLIRSVPGKEALRVGGTTIPLHVFNAALAELGYELKKVV